MSYTARLDGTHIFLIPYYVVHFYTFIFAAAAAALNGRQNIFF